MNEGMCVNAETSHCLKMSILVYYKHKKKTLDMHQVVIRKLHKINHKVIRQRLIL